MTVELELRPEVTLAKLWEGHQGHFHRADDTPWDESDEAVLETALGMFAHVDTHDIVECGKRTPIDQLKEMGRVEWIAVREAEDLTLEELASMFGLTKGTVSRWETGRRDPTDLRYLAWLRESDRRQADRISFDIWRMTVRRDDWTLDQLSRYGSVRHWDAVWNAGGLYFKWFDSGTLPHFTPADAGVTG